jgi:transcriptional regulator GlxA family with amidase domain
MTMTNFDILLFDGFETLDAFGPAEIAGHLGDIYALAYRSPSGGIVESAQGVRVETQPMAGIAPGGVLLLPGGIGTRALARDEAFLRALRKLAEGAAYVLTVCTGSGLLAATGFLNGRYATTNKKAFSWPASVGPRVSWVRKARWIVDGNVYSSSGVSAGMDMTLGFFRDLHGRTRARAAAEDIEYVWNENSSDDPFAI